MKLVVTGWFQSQHDPNKLVQEMANSKAKWIAKQLEADPDSFFITSLGELIEANFKFVKVNDNWVIEQKRYIESMAHLKLVANSLAHFIAIISSKGFVDILLEDEDGYGKVLYEVIDGVIWQKRLTEYYVPITQPFTKIGTQLELLWCDIWLKVRETLLELKNKLPTFDDDDTPAYEQEKIAKELAQKIMADVLVEYLFSGEASKVSQ